MHEDAKKMHRTKILVKKFGKLRRRHLGGHDLVRRMDRQGEVLTWCRKCSGFAWQRMGPKLMNRFKTEQMGTKEHGKMLKRIQGVEDGTILAKEATHWKKEGQKRIITRKGYQRLLNMCEMEGFMAEKGLWNLAREKVLRERGALRKEEGDVIREYKAMHEETFLSIWLREDGERKRKNN